MDTYMHKTMASIASLEKIEIIRSEEFMPSEARLKFLKKMIILGPKTAILGPQFCRILVLGPHFWWAPLDLPLIMHLPILMNYHLSGKNKNWHISSLLSQGFSELFVSTELPNNELTSIQTPDLPHLLL